MRNRSGYKRPKTLDEINRAIRDYEIRLQYIGDKGPRARECRRSIDALKKIRESKFEIKKR